MNEIISIIMSTYNEKTTWVKESIESILNQTYSNIEFIIVVDNPLNIEIIEIVKKYEKRDIRIRLFINDENKGLVYSLNRALEHATGKYIARMDADDISHLDRLEKQLAYLTKHNLDLMGSNVTLFDHTGIFYTTNKLLTHKYIKKMLRYGTIGIVHPTFFAKQEVFRVLNGYNHSIHTEDKDFLARTFCNKFKVGNTKDVLLDCRYNSESITKNNAIYIYKIGTYVTKVFNSCLKNGQYNFNEEYYTKLQISQKEKDDFNKKQSLMGEARKELTNKKYIRFLYKFIKAFNHAKLATFLSIKINIFFKLFKILENIELKLKG